MPRKAQFPSLFVIGAAAIAAVACGNGCTVGPKYQRATAPVPAKWDVAEPWRESASPSARIHAGSSTRPIHS